MKLTKLQLIFIAIIALSLLGSIYLYKVFKAAPALEPIEGATNSCIQEKIQPFIQTLASRGGLLTPKDTFTIENSQITVLVSNTTLTPSQKILAQQIKVYLEATIPACVQEKLAKHTISEAQATVTLQPKEVMVKVKFPKILYGRKEITHTVDVSVASKLGLLQLVAAQLIESIKKNPSVLPHLSQLDLRQENVFISSSKFDEDKYVVAIINKDNQEVFVFGVRI